LPAWKAWTTDDVAPIARHVIINPWRLAPFQRMPMNTPSTAPTAAAEPSVDPGSAQSALHSMEALVQAWGQGPDARKELNAWVNQEGPIILWRWGWHFPAQAEAFAVACDQCPSRSTAQNQALKAAGFAVLGSWEGQQIDPPLSFEMWTEWEGDSVHRMANVQWEFSPDRQAASMFDARLIHAAQMSLCALAESAAESEGWYDDNDERKEDCDAKEFLTERLPEATSTALSAPSLLAQVASLMSSVVQRHALEGAALAAETRPGLAARL
jgi:hypothetical protein